MKFNYLFYILLTFMISGCISSDNTLNSICATEGNQESVFGVNEVTATVTSLGTSKGTLPSDFQVTFNACFVDKLKLSGVRLTNISVGILTFEEADSSEIKNLKIPSKGYNFYQIPADRKNRYFKKIERSTDDSGCITWTEQHRYKMPSEDKWIQFERVFENQSGFKTSVPLIINPWTAEQKKVYDYRYARDKFKTSNKDDVSGIFIHKKPVDKEDTDVQQCVDKISLSRIFKHFEKKDQKKRPIIWIPEVRFNSNSVYVERPSDKSNTDQVRSYYFDHKICEYQNKKVCDLVGGFFKVGMSLFFQALGKTYVQDDKNLDVTQGRFKVSLQFGALTKDKIYRLHRDKYTFDVDLEERGNGNTRLVIPEFTMHFPFETSEKDVQLFLTVEDKADELETFYGSYHISTGLDGFQSDGVLSIQALSDLERNVCRGDKGSLCKKYGEVEHFKKNYSQVEFNPDLTNHPSFSRFELGLQLKRMRFVRVRKDSKEYCESPVRRTTVYIGEVCFTDTVRGREFTNQNFSISAIRYENMDDLIESDVKEIGEGGEALNASICDPNTNADCVFKCDPRKENCASEKNSLHTIAEGRNTDKNGCIQFLYDIPHKRYNVQRYFPVKLTFKSNAYGFENHKYVSLNPWTEAFLTYQDITQAVQTAKSTWQKTGYLDAESKKPFDQLSSRLADPPLVRMNEFRNIMIEPTYKVEPSLKLTTQKNLMFLTTPRVYRTDNLGSGDASEPMILPRGYYILRALLLRGPQETKKSKDIILDILHKSFNIFNVTQNISKVFDGENFSLFKKDTLSVQKSGKEVTFTEEDYISHFDSVVYSDNGVVSSFIHYRWIQEQFRLLGSRNTVLFQLLPTNPQYYQYKDSSCRLDIADSKFTPFTDHDLRTPYHFGLFFSGEYAGGSVLQYIDENKVDIDDIFKNKRPTKDELIQKYQRITAVDQFGKEKDKWTEISEQVQTDESKTLMSRYVLNQATNDPNYCVVGDQSVDNYFRNIDLNTESITGQDGLWIRACVCDQGKPVIDEIENCVNQRSDILVQENLRLQKESAVGVPEDQVFSSKELFCSEENNSSPYYNCICSRTPHLSLVESKAVCMSRQEGLALAYEEDFSDKELFHQWIDFEKSPPYSKNLCEFWWDELYKNILTQEHLDSYLNRYIHAGDRLKSIGELEHTVPTKEELLGTSFKKARSKYGNDFLDSCKNNPYQFFSIEKKIIPNTLLSAQYQGGKVYNITLAKANSKEARNDTNNRSDLSLHAKIGAYFVDGSKGIQSSTSTTESARFNSQFTQAVILAVNHIEATIDTDKYMKCLTIKPRKTSFFGSDETDMVKYAYENMGLMLCSKETDRPIQFKEDYYYVHHFFGGHSHEFMSRTIYQNRPFVLFLRGQSQLWNFIQLASLAVHNIDRNELNKIAVTHMREQDTMEGLVDRFKEVALQSSNQYGGVYTYFEPLPKDIVLGRSMNEGVGVLSTTAYGLEKFHDLLDWLGNLFE